MTNSLALQEHRPADLAAVTRGLSERAIKFAEIRASGVTLHRAVILAGYAPASKRNATSIGYSLSRDERVAALISHYARNLVQAAAPRAVRVIETVMEDKTAKPADRVRAAKVLLDKSLPTLQHHRTEGRLQHQHEHTVRPAATLDDLRREAGLLPPAPALDAEFEVIAPAADPEEWCV